MNFSKLAAILGIALISLGNSVLAADKEITIKDFSLDCIAKVVNRVNKHHTLAEGGVYAIRLLYSGNSGAAFLVGHSDETDPTDYLVSVADPFSKKNACSVKSIVWADEAGSVTEYTEAETEIVGRAQRHYIETQTARALELFDKMPVTSYGIRQLCVTGENVTAIYPVEHWSQKDVQLAEGKINNFPNRVRNLKDVNEDADQVMKIIAKRGKAVRSDEGVTIVKAPGYVFEKSADICLVEQKAVLESLNP